MLITKKTNQLFNQRLAAILLLGFSSGLPLTLTGSTLQAWFTEAHINIVAIGSLSLIGLPYALKFLWSPLMDHYTFSGHDRRKAWILLTQPAIVVTLLFLAFLDPHSHATLMAGVAFFVAFFAASQDIAIDAYRTDILSQEERGLGVSYFVFAYRVALFISGGLALVFADYMGWKQTYILMALLVLMSMMLTFKVPKIEEALPSSSHLFQTIKQSMLNLLRRESAVLLLFFILFYKLGDALALSLMTNFLLQGLGFSLTEVGLAYKLVTFIGIIFGSFVGGVLLIRWSLFRALLVFGLAQSFSNLTFIALALLGKNFLFMSTSIFIENFCSGLSTAAFFAFLMSLCDHRYSATQFALLSTIASFGRVFLGPVAGFMVESLGWIQFFVWSFVLCFPGIFLLLLLKKKVASYAYVTAD